MGVAKPRARPSRARTKTLAIRKRPTPRLAPASLRMRQPPTTVPRRHPQPPVHHPRVSQRRLPWRPLLPPRHLRRRPATVMRILTPKKKKMAPAGGTRPRRQQQHHRQGGDLGQFIKAAVTTACPYRNAGPPPPHCRALITAMMATCPRQQRRVA